MKNVLELLYDQPSGIHEQESPFVRTARIKVEHMAMRNAAMTDEQKDLWEADFQADTKIEGMVSFERFRSAFHMGTQLMSERVEGKEELLK